MRKRIYIFMNNIEQLSIHFVKRQKHAEISLQRLNNIIYLYDWIHVLMFGETFTSIDWKYANYTLNSSELSKVVKHSLFFEHKKENDSTIINIILWNDDYETHLNPRQYRLLEHIDSHTKKLTYYGVLSHVYSTFPIQRPERCENLDLLESAKEFKKNQKPNKWSKLIPYFFEAAS